MSHGLSSRSARTSHPSAGNKPSARWATRGTITALLGALATALTGIGACEPIDGRRPTVADASIGIDPLQPMGDAGLGGGPQGSPDAAANPESLLALSRAEIDFGPVVTGFAARDTVLVKNLGNGVLQVPEVRLAATSDPDFSLLVSQCDKPLDPGQTCEVRVGALPTKLGILQGALEVASGGSVLSVHLVVTGLEPGDLLLSATAGGSEDFGQVPIGTTVESTFRITNPTEEPSGPLTLSASNPDFALLESEGCGNGTSLEAGAGCDLRIAFTPSGRGRSEATLTVQSPIAGNISVGLSGDGLAPGALGVSPDQVDFGQVVLGTNGTATLNVTNDGDIPLTLAGVSLAGDHVDDFAIQESTCGEAVELPGAGECRVTLVFRPVSVPGARSATLSIALSSGTAVTVPLVGFALEPGVLEIAAAAGGSAQLGAVLLGSTREQAFELVNPGGQASGTLTISANGDFQVLEPIGEAECSSTTSLVDGQSCSLRVRFAPTARGPRDGSLTVVSSLAGGSSLPLSGIGIVPPELEIVQTDVDFGQVVVGNAAPATLTVRNAGDQPLSPPSVVLGEVSSGEARAFELSSRCEAELAFDATCEIDLTFQPQVPGPHSARLEVGSPNGGSATLLMVGTAVARGSLVAAAAPGGSTNFGDVERNTPQTRQFTLTNPGGVPSGALSFASSNPVFTAAQGDCNGPGAGLVDGSSCTFSVAFLPTVAGLVNASITISSAGAGATSLAVSGRGRNPAALSATGSRDFGTANVGQAAITEDRNQFTWTVSNTGDLASGALSTVNSNLQEFEVTNNTCTNSSLAGAASCQMAIRFRPSAAGRRSGSVTVSDASGRSARLDMTGTGVQLAGPGQSCVNVGCAQGVCTAGVCCNRQCNAACQFCSRSGANAGQCVDQTNGEACGTGAGQCFGVDRCRLPAGQPCTGNDAECGNGNCEPRLGSNANVCCLEACATGERCNAQTGLCEVPASGQGGPCGSGLPPCAQPLTCVDNVCCDAACNRTCESCNAAGSCVADTGGCGSGRTCQGRNICECPTGTELCNGSCISSAAGSCCTIDDCNDFEICNTNNTCGCQANAVRCNGACRAPGSCCTTADCGGTGVGTCGGNGVCACVGEAFGARCAGRFLGLGVVPAGDVDSEAMAVSGNGNVVVGWSSFGDVQLFPRAARWVWQSNQRLSLGALADSESDVPTSIATAVSEDGSVVVGDASTELFGSAAMVPFRWTQADGLDALPADEFSLITHVEAISGTGAVTVGWVESDGGNNVGARWRTPNNPLEVFSASPESFRILATSGNGALLAGDHVNAPVTLNTAATGDNRFRPIPLGGFSSGFVTAISANGSHLAGVLNGVAVHWVNSGSTATPSIGTPQDLGPGQAHDVSNDGVVVGESGGAAVVWTNSGTQRTVMQILEAGRANGLAGWAFQRANAISDNGLVIVGAGTRSGRRQGWVVRLPQAL